MTKTCTSCGAAFSRKPNRSHAQWERMTCCSAACANRVRAQAQRPILTTYQRWAAQWERARRIEDRKDLKAWKPKRYPSSRLSARPRARRFTAGTCQACGEPWLYYADRAQSPYCAACNNAHHRRPANRRAKQNGREYEPIIPRRVFERDGYRCQLCKRKTRGTFPHPLSPTVDHIIPLARGGPHVYSNVQCACFRCNSQKQDGPANDQLRLAIVA